MQVATTPVHKVASVAEALRVPFDQQTPEGSYADVSFPATFLGNEHGGVFADPDDLAYARCPCSPVINASAKVLPGVVLPDVIKGVELLSTSSMPWEPGQAPMWGNVQVTGRIHDAGDHRRFTATEMVVLEQD